MGVPDLAAAAIPFVLNSGDTLPGAVSSGQTVDLDLALVNAGDGTLGAGESFDYTLYIARSNDAAEFESASAVVLDSGVINVAADVAPGAALNIENITAALPYGLASGIYFIGVELDEDGAIQEQGVNPNATPANVDGELNNAFFSASPILYVATLSLFDALEDGTSAISFVDGDVAGFNPSLAVDPYLQQGLDGSALWFGRDDIGDPVAPDDDFVFTGGNGVQSPDLSAGEFAEFSLRILSSSLVRFDWGVSSGSDANTLRFSSTECQLQRYRVTCH